MIPRTDLSAQISQALDRLGAADAATRQLAEVCYALGYFHGHRAGYARSEHDTAEAWKPLAERVRRCATTATWAEVLAARAAATDPDYIRRWMAEHAARLAEHHAATLRRAGIRSSSSERGAAA